MYRRIILAAAAALALLGPAGPVNAQTGKVTVFAAASLKNALDAAAAKWKTEGGGETAISYAASSALAKQIENGAPADLFISADLDWMDYLDKRKQIDAKTRVNLLGNKLVLIAPKDSTAKVTIGPGFPLATLLGTGRLSMADPAAVPAGLYGKAALTKLGVWDAVSGKVAAAENVRAALLLVARGETPFGIVYATDAAVEPGVRIVADFPEDSHPPIVYPMAQTNSGSAAAAALAKYLEGAAARDIFVAHGFTVLTEGK